MICRENGAHINLLLDHVIYHVRPCAASLASFCAKATTHPLMCRAHDCSVTAICTWTMLGRRAALQQTQLATSQLSQLRQTMKGTAGRHSSCPAPSQVHTGQRCPIRMRLLTAPPH